MTLARARGREGRRCWRKLEATLQQIYDKQSAAPLQDNLPNPLETLFAVASLRHSRAGPDSHAEAGSSCTEERAQGGMYSDSLNSGGGDTVTQGGAESMTESEVLLVDPTGALHVLEGTDPSSTLLLRDPEPWCATGRLRFRSAGRGRRKLMQGGTLMTGTKEEQAEGGWGRGAPQRCRCCDLRRVRGAVRCGVL